MAMPVRNVVLPPHPWHGRCRSNRSGIRPGPIFCCSKLAELRNRAPPNAGETRADGGLSSISLRSTLISAFIASSIAFNAGPPSLTDTFRDVPSTLSGSEKAQRIQKPKSAKAESCTRKCVSTCIRGGGGAPGEGPLNVRKPLVVFKEGFRSRQYCLVECSDICNLIGDGDDGP